MITQSNDIKRFFERLGLRMNFHKPKRVSPAARHNLEYIPTGSIVVASRVQPLLVYYFRDVYYSGFDTYNVRLEDFKEHGHGAAGTCRICGCTENDACVDKKTQIPCAWADGDLCTACVAEVHQQMRPPVRSLAADFGKGQRNG